jgi:hypothetical protein
MNRRSISMMIVITGIFAAVTALAQRPAGEQTAKDGNSLPCTPSPATPQSGSYNHIMKAIDAVSASLKKNLDGTGAQGVDEIILNERGGLIRVAADRLRKPPAEEQIQACSAAAIQDATKLQEFLKQVQEFWAYFDTHDAVDLARSGQDAAATVVDKLKGKDFDAAQVSFGTIRETCRDCHFSHRQTTRTGFIIKP